MTSDRTFGQHCSCASEKSRFPPQHVRVFVTWEDPTLKGVMFVVYAAKPPHYSRAYAARAPCDLCAECGGDLTTPTGIMSSPNYPGQYAHARRCHWFIRVAPTRRIALTFVDLDIQLRIYHRRRLCIGDRVQVRSAVARSRWE